MLRNPKNKHWSRPLSILCRERRRRNRRALACESLESRQLLAANPIVTSPDGTITIGADFASPEVHTLGWTESLSDITIDTGLPTVSGYARTDSTSLTLAGSANSSRTSSVHVGGNPVTWSPAEGTWSDAQLDLNPGINRILVQAFDANGKETDRNYVDIWRDTSGTSALPVSIPFGSTWSYLDDGSDQGTAWRSEPHSPPWQTGAAQLGYGDGDETTVVNGGPSNNRIVTTYFTRTFDIPAGQAEFLDQITIDLLRDDGAAVYLNGVEVVRTDNLPGTLGDNAVRYNTWADLGSTGDNTRSSFVVPESLTPGLLHDGENTIAVEIHQHDAGSSDISFDLGLTAIEKPKTGFESVSGTLPAGTTIWSAEAGPYLITSNVTIPPNGQLVIEPGTTVYFENEQSLIVRGQIVAEGTLEDRIRFTRVPGSGTVSDGIQFSSTMQDNRITYAVIEWGGTTTNNGLIGLDNSKLTLDHVTLDHAERRRIRSIDSALTVRNSVFADIFAPNSPPSTDNLSEHIWGRNVPAGESFIVENNIFGTTAGHNDVIDFDAGFRPDPIPQILNNTFLGGGDDAMDFEGDVHIEANLVMNFIKDPWNTGSGNSNGISAGVGRHYFMTRNIFYNVEHVAQVKQDSFLTFVNNTVVDALVSATYYQRPTGGEFGRGAYLDGNIFANTPVVLDEYVSTTDITLNRSAIETNEGTFGTGNITSDVMLADPTAFDFSLLPSSPAIGAGPNGVDMGALIPPGATLSGEPAVFTTETSATLEVGGPDMFAYRYRVDNGTWSDPVLVASPGTKEQVIPPIQLDSLAPGEHSVAVIKQSSAGVWQAEALATQSLAWIVEDGVALIDAICREMNTPSLDDRLDLDGSGVVDFEDVRVFVEETVGTRIGDADLGGTVDGVDFGVWDSNKFTIGTGWASGDFNCDGFVDGSDFNLWNANRFVASPPASQSPHASARAALSVGSAAMLVNWTDVDPPNRPTAVSSTAKAEPFAGPNVVPPSLAGDRHENLSRRLDHNHHPRFRRESNSQGIAAAQVRTKTHDAYFADLSEK
ncbi:MAG: hypothetical protein KDA60_03125 [Planctomycetales bacterium]|nr:hypothetical protein [Planctomycetales bacterium]